MKIAIISDSHDNLANVKKAIDLIKKEGVKMILHCGDICTTTILREIMSRFSGKAHIVFGNADEDQFRITRLQTEYPARLKVWGELGEVKIGVKKIAFTHFPKSARDLVIPKNPAPYRTSEASSGSGYDLVFYGHTHKPWEEKIGKTRLINPGNLAGIIYSPTFAIYDTKSDKMELKILN